MTMEAGVPTRLAHEAAATLFFHTLALEMGTAGFSVTDSSEAPLMSISQAGVIGLGVAGQAATIKGSLNVDQAVTLDTTLGVTGALTATADINANGNIVGDAATTISGVATVAVGGHGLGGGEALGVTGSVGISANLTVAGNFTVNGTTTTVATTNLVVTDSIIELGNGTSGTPTGDAGIVIERGDNDNVGMFWDANASTFVFADGSITGASTGALTYADYMKLRVGALTADDQSTFTAGLTDGVATLDGSGGWSGIAGLAMTAAFSGATTGSFSGLLTSAAITASGLITANAGLSAASGQTITDGVASLTSGALSGVTTLAMGGALTGATTGAFSGTVTAGAFNDGAATYDAGVISSAASATFSGLVTAGSFNDGAATYDAGVISSGVSATFSGLVTAGSFNDGTATYDAGVISSGVSASFSGEVAMGSLDLNGAAQVDGTITVGVDDTGYDVKFFGASAGKFMLWDESADKLAVNGETYLAGPTTVSATFTTGSDDEGLDVTFFGATASKSWLWDASADSMIINGSTAINSIMDEDNMSSDSATSLATQQSIKAYVDTEVAALNAANDLDFQADTGGALSIGLSSETMTLSGGNGISSVGSANDVTFNIDASNTTQTSLANLVTVGALASGSIAPGFGTIDTNSAVTISANLIVDGGTVDIDVASDFSGLMTLSGAADLVLNDSVVMKLGTSGADGALFSDGTDVNLYTLSGANLFIEVAGAKETKASHDKTAGTYLAGEVLTYVAGALAKADPSSHSFPAGLASEANSAVVYSTQGEVYEAPAAANLGTVGHAVYWDVTAGQLVDSAPTWTAGDQIWRLGYTHTVGLGTSKLVWMPQFIGVA